MAAVLQGIAFNHRTHVDALRTGFPFREARLTGGGSRNPAFAQMFADTLDLPVTVAPVDEAAAFGAALCAGAGVGRYRFARRRRAAVDGAGLTYQPEPGAAPRTR